LICPAGTAPISEALLCVASCHVAGEALAMVKAGRIAPPVSTPIAVTRAPAWLVMLVNMAGVSILLRLTACWSGSVNALAAIPLTAVSVA
jgi:hypothetical protein